VFEINFDIYFIIYILVVVHPHVLDSAAALLADVAVETDCMYYGRHSILVGRHNRYSFSTHIFCIDLDP